MKAVAIYNHSKSHEVGRARYAVMSMLWEDRLGASADAVGQNVNGGAE